MSQVAQETIKALGGNKFIAMTGAKNLMALENGLQFNLPRGASNKANIVQVTINDKDLYCLAFYSLRGVNCREIESVNNIFVEDLRTVFTDKTGLLTSLGACA